MTYYRAYAAWLPLSEARALAAAPPLTHRLALMRRAAQQLVVDRRVQAERAQRRARWQATLKAREWA